MGQYWVVANLDKKEFIHPHKLASGLKMWEQIANHPGAPEALFLLLTSHPKVRGGGDCEKNEYIGRWIGDRVVVVGDYAEETDLEWDDIPADLIYRCCCDSKDSFDEIVHNLQTDDSEEIIKLGQRMEKIGVFTDISEHMCKILENELDGKFVGIGNGWRVFKKNEM